MPQRYVFSRNRVRRSLFFVGRKGRRVPIGSALIRRRPVSDFSGCMRIPVRRCGRGDAVPRGFRHMAGSVAERRSRLCAVSSGPRSGVPGGARIGVGTEAGAEFSRAIRRRASADGWYARFAAALRACGVFSGPGGGRGGAAFPPSSFLTGSFRPDVPEGRDPGFFHGEYRGGQPFFTEGGCREVCGNAEIVRNGGGVRRCVFFRRAFRIRFRVFPYLCMNPDPGCHLPFKTRNLVIR